MRALISRDVVDFVIVLSLARYCELVSLCSDVDYVNKGVENADVKSLEAAAAAVDVSFHSQPVSQSVTLPRFRHGGLHNIHLSNLIMAQGSIRFGTNWFRLAELS